MNSNDLTIREMCRLGRDVLENRDMQALRTFPQHGTVSRYEHCLAVCYIALRLADKWRVRVDRRSMVRGALLHDFFMYNWNDPASMRPLHGFTHAREALCNAQKQFELNEIERDVIKKHMFPLNIALPRYRETALVSAADKISAYIKCVQELRGGTDEFRRAAAQTREAIRRMDFPAAEAFLAEFGPAFSLSLDELQEEDHERI